MKFNGKIDLRINFRAGWVSIIVEREQ